jgi:hypothetical protein
MAALTINDDEAEATGVWNPVVELSTALNETLRCARANPFW